MAQPEVDSATERRVNELLRHALDKFLQGQHDRVNEFDVYLFRATWDKINALPSPGPMQVRLRGLVERALTQYADLAERLAQQPPGEPAPAEAPAEPAGVVVPASELFAGGNRAHVADLAGVPLDQQLRVFEHAGPLTVQGDLPEDALLIVRGGNLVVHGAVQGHGLAERDIRIFGNVQGGCIVSERGGIETERILSGARLIAPWGDILATAVERPGLLVAGGALRVRGDIVGARCRAAQVVTQGVIRGSDVQVLQGIDAAALEGDAREPTRIVFRRVLASGEYGKALPEEALVLARTLTRGHFGAVAGAALSAALHGEWCGAQRALLYHLAGPKAGAPGLESLRTAQLHSVFHGWHAQAADALLESLQEAMEIDGSLLRGALMQAGEEGQAMVRALEKEIGALPDEVARAAKEPLLGAGRHLASHIKRLQEAAQRKEAMEPHFEQLARKKAEWQGSAAAALAEVDSHLPLLREVIGPAAEPGQAGDKLNIFVRLEMDKARKDPARARLAEGVLFRGLLASAERAQAALIHWSKQLAPGRAAWEQARASLQAQGWLRALPDPAAPRMARAASCTSGVVIAATPLAAQPEDVGYASALRLALPVGQPTVFHIEGQMVRRAPPRLAG